MPQKRVKTYEVYRDAEEISLEEISWESENTLKVRLSVDGRPIKDVIFKRDIASRAYAVPPTSNGSQSSAVTVLFGGMVQEILDNLADYLLPPMKPLGLNPLTGEKWLDSFDRTSVREIENTKQKINGHHFVWKMMKS